MKESRWLVHSGLQTVLLIAAAAASATCYCYFHYWKQSRAFTNIGALIIRIAFRGTLYYHDIKQPPKPYSNYEKAPTSPMFYSTLIIVSPLKNPLKEP